jgi:hypothetical protein
VRLPALALALLLPLGAVAQESAPPLQQDPRAPRFREVERGLFTGFEVGYLTFFKTPSAGKFPYASAGGGRSDGFVVGGTVGYDVADWFALSAYVLGSGSQASVSYGAFSLFSGGADARFALLRTRDAYQVQRFSLYLHARAGYMMSYPEGLFANSGLYLAGGPGLEYYTHLRHFSVGLAVDIAYAQPAKSAGLAVTPTLRYTF